MYEAGGSRRPKFQQQYVDGCCFLGYQKTFDTAWHTGLLYKLSALEFSTSLFKLIASFLTEGIFKVMVEVGFSTKEQ
jgi:hypothetical protein